MFSPSQLFFCVVVLCFIALEVSESSMFQVMSTGLLRARKARERRPSATVNTYNEEGEIDQLRNVDIAIGNSSPVVVMQCRNGTLVSYIDSSNCIPESVSTNFTTRHKFSKLRIRIVGADFITELMNPSLALVVTGLAADCGMTIKSALQYVVNATHAFGVAPPGRLIAKSIADLFLKATLGSDRPFACHAFVCDMRNTSIETPVVYKNAHNNSTQTTERSSQGVIYEIEPSGNVQQVYGSVIGAGAGALTRSKGKTSGYDVLEAEYVSPDCDIEDAKTIASKVLRHCADHSWLADISHEDDSNHLNSHTQPTINVVHKLIPYMK